MKNSSIGGHGNAPGVSVLMPAHNSEKTIFRAIESTLKALNADSELIICLDGCTDRTQEIVLSFNDERIKVITNSRSEGIASSRNKLLKLATKPYVATMDSDDICLKGRFRSQLKLIREINVDFVFANCILFGSFGKFFMIMPQLPFGLNADESRVALLFGCPFIHSTMLARRECVIALGGYRDVPSEDYDLWMRAAVAGQSLVRSPTYGVLYRRHKPQTSQSVTWLSHFRQDHEIVKSGNSLAERLGIPGLSTIESIHDFNKAAYQQARKEFGKLDLRLLRLAGVRKYIGLW